MTSILETALRAQIASAFAGQLLTCTLRRVASETVDAKGHPVDGTVTTFTFDGFVDNFTAAFATAAGVPVTDARLTIISGSLSTTPEADDQVKVRSTWYQLRRRVARDPANAHEEWAAFEIIDPTA